MLSQDNGLLLLPIISAQTLFAKRTLIPLKKFYCRDFICVICNGWCELIIFVDASAREQQLIIGFDWGPVLQAGFPVNPGEVLWGNSG